MFVKEHIYEKRREFSASSTCGTSAPGSYIRCQFDLSAEWGCTPHVCQIDESCFSHKPKVLHCVHRRRKRGLGGGMNPPSSKRPCLLRLDCDNEVYKCFRNMKMNEGLGNRGLTGKYPDMHAIIREYFRAPDSRVV